MTAATANKPKRTPRKRKSDANIEAQAAEIAEKLGLPHEKKPEPPRCGACYAELTWRDRFYVPAARKRCKRCHQKEQREELRAVHEAGEGGERQVRYVKVNPSAGRELRRDRELRRELGVRNAPTQYKRQHMPRKPEDIDRRKPYKHPARSGKPMYGRSAVATLARAKRRQQQKAGKAG